MISYRRASNNTDAETPAKADDAKPPIVSSDSAPPPKPPVRIPVLLDRNPSNRSAISQIPIPKGERGENFTPQVLSKPLGLPFRPEAGQNTPIDTRSLSERRADFTSYDKALERRLLLFRSFVRPYFQEWKRMDHYKGKSFVSNARLLRKETARWFPNMWGQTLRREGDGANGGRDTTPVLAGRVSVVGLQSGVWAEQQVNSFIGEKENPTLGEIMAGSRGLLQRVDINVQERFFRALLVKLFKGRLRKSMPEEQWGRYFMLRLARDTGRGLTEDIRDAMGFLNSQVGYVYLLDTECKIRWAGSGHAWKGEVDGLNAGIKRLVEEARTGQKPAPTQAASMGRRSQGAEQKGKVQPELA